MPSSKRRLHNGGYSCIEAWENPNNPPAGQWIRIGGKGADAFAEVGQVGTVEDPALYRFIQEYAKQNIGVQTDAELSGVAIGAASLFGAVAPGAGLAVINGLLRSVTTSDTIAGQIAINSLQFQSVLVGAPLYVDFLIDYQGANDTAILTLSFQHSIMS